jgi:ATP-binding protein involved in chromosome partitioning
VEVIGLVENMSHFTCPHCQQVIDIFSSGGAERTAQQYGLEFLGSVELDPEIRSGGDRGLPVTLAGPESTIAGPFFEVAKKVAARAKEIAETSEPILEIS